MIADEYMADFLNKHLKVYGKYKSDKTLRDF